MGLAVGSDVLFLMQIYTDFYNDIPHVTFIIRILEKHNNQLAVTCCALLLLHLSIYNYIFLLNSFYGNIFAIKLALSYSFLYLCISLPDVLIRRMTIRMLMYYINPDIAPHFVCLNL